MSVLGKVLAALSIIGALTSVFFATRVLQVRNEWMKRVEQRKAAYLKVTPDLPKLQKQLWDLQREHHRLNYDWGAVWNDVLVQQGTQGPGSIVVNGIGAAQGLRQDQVVHGFQPDGQGGSSYVGPFRITTLADDRVLAVANWPIRPSDAATWLVGQNWRFRANAPTSDVQNFTRYQKELLVKDVEHADRLRSKDLAEKRDRKFAEDHLRYRIDELHGDLGLQNQKGQLPNEVIDGLVKAIEDDEEARNLLLLEVDRLRHDLKRLYDEIQELQLRNATLAESLPGSDEPASADPGDKSVGAE